MTGTSAQTRRPPTRIVPRRRLRDLAVVVLAVVGVAACSSSGSSGGSSTSGGAGSSSSTIITIKDFAFTTPASVSPGATVTVHNLDSVAHSVTADSGNAFDSPAQPGDSSFKAPTKPGSYPFHCTPHPEMHGVLVVK